MVKVKVRPSITVTLSIITLGSGFISKIVPVLVKSCAPIWAEATTPTTFINSSGSFILSIKVGMLKELSVFALLGSVVSVMVKDL